MTFFNTVLQLVWVNILFWGTELGAKLWSEDGLANDLWFFQVLGVLDLIGEVVKPKYIVVLLKRWFLKRKSKGQKNKFGDDDSLDCMQKEANELFEYFDFCFDERLSKYCKMLLICFFICSMFPLAPLISIVYMMIFYWADKLFLIRLAKVPSFCTGHIGHSMLRFFDFALVIYTGGYLLFINVIEGRYGTTQIALFVISLLLLLINVKFWIKVIFGEPEGINIDKLSFKEARKHFHCNTYDQCNPIDKLKRTLHMYAAVDFFKLRESSLF